MEILNYIGWLLPILRWNQSLTILSSLLSERWGRFDRLVLWGRKRVFIKQRHALSTSNRVSNIPIPSFHSTYTIGSIIESTERFQDDDEGPGGYDVIISEVVHWCKQANYTLWRCCSDCFKLTLLSSTVLLSVIMSHSLLHSCYMIVLQACTIVII